MRTSDFLKLEKLIVICRRNVTPDQIVRWDLTSHDQTTVLNLLQVVGKTDQIGSIYGQMRYNEGGMQLLADLLGVILEFWTQPTEEPILGECLGTFTPRT